MIRQMSAFAVGCLAAAFLVTGPANAQEVYGDPRTPATARVLTATIHSRDAEEVRYLVLGRLTDRYADEKGITVTQAERDAYNKRVQEGLEEDRKRHEARRDELARRLANRDLPADQQATLRKELESENGAIAALAPPSGNAEELKAAREEIAAAFIRQWKINRALYRQYGGRVIFQQGGPEPLDAYRKFLEEQHARGDFTILDKDVEAAFWRYYRTDSLHSFFPPGSREEAQVFDSPPWRVKD